MSAWVPVVVNALAFAIQQAKSLGLDPPGIDEVKKIKQAVDDKLNEVLPLTIIGVATVAVGVAAEAGHEIDSMSKSPYCPRCKVPAVQNVEKQVDGPGTVRLSCSSCDWTLP